MAFRNHTLKVGDQVRYHWYSKGELHQNGPFNISAVHVSPKGTRVDIKNEMEEHKNVRPECLMPEAWVSCLAGCSVSHRILQHLKSIVELPPSVRAGVVTPLQEDIKAWLGSLHG